MSISALMIVLLWQISATSIVADFLSDHDCIKCLCVVETNSPDCIREQCDRDSTATDKNNLNFFNNFGNNHNNNNNHNNVNNNYTKEENNHFINTKKQNNEIAAMSEENQTKNNTSEHHTPIGLYFSNWINRPRPYVHSTEQTDVLIDLDNQYPVPLNQIILERQTRSCGPFNLDIHYYIKCGRPDIQHGDGDTTAFARCATNTKCATKCVQNYINKYQSQCHGQSSCEMWSRIHFGHNVGISDGSGCQSVSTFAQWKEVKKCLDQRRGNTTKRPPHKINLPMNNTKTRLTPTNHTTLERQHIKTTTKIPVKLKFNGG